ncbi:flagellar biosynthesis protein FlgI (plasmid) [Sphingomonas paeninsulae]|uniref:Flagellar biosynthesis protein FlgI n=1 Tax=Sphingomonas paeninsulae TaxID=2319844 RepID=A0A494T739_SPHPE|nr:rod-binding protein [Sphingomonas paeninsulae]AYJ85209.1 flagellar biosynthesis protein FlgI [Sphingomonas paeninsulae]
MIAPVSKAAATVAATPLVKAAKSFEAVFLRQMIGAMRSPSLGEDVFGSNASNQFRDMSDARLADSMAGKFGIAQMLEKQFKDQAK